MTKDIWVMVLVVLVLMVMVLVVMVLMVMGVGASGLEMPQGVQWIVYIFICY